MSEVLKIKAGAMMRIALVSFIILTGTHWVKAGGRLSMKDLTFHSNEPDTSKALRYFQSGVKKYLAKDYTGAIAEFNTVVALEPSYWEAFRFRGDARRELKEFDLAIADYTQAIALNKSYLLSYRGRAEAKSSIKDFEGALKDYNACIELNPEDYDTYYDRAGCYFYLNRFKESIGDYSTCIELKPVVPKTYLWRGFVYGKDSQVKKSADDLSRYFHLGGTANIAFYFRGFAYFQMNPSNILYADSAIIDLKKYILSGEEQYKQYSYAFLGGAYAAKGDSVEARKNFKRAIQLAPDDFVTYSLWGKAEFNFRNNAKALELFQKALTLAKTPDSDLFYNLGMTKTRLCDITGALEDYKKALEVDSLNVDVYETRFLTIFRSSVFDNNELTLSDINHLIGFSETKERTADLYSARSLINLRAKKNDEAKKDIEKAVELMPSNPVHYIINGLISTSLGENKDLILADYDKAEKLNTKLWQPYLAKGYFYREQGDTKKACEYMKKAVKRGAKLTEGLRNYLCQGIEKLNTRDTAVEFIAYNYLIVSVMNGNSKSIDCSQGYK